MNYSKVKLTIHAYVGASLRGRPLVTRLGAPTEGTPLQFRHVGCAVFALLSSEAESLSR